MPTCAQAASLPLSYKTNKHKATRSAETGRTRTTARLPEYFIMFLLAVRSTGEEQRVCVCVCVWMHMCKLRAVYMCADNFSISYMCGCQCVYLCVVGSDRPLVGLAVKAVLSDSLWPAAAVSSSELSDAPERTGRSHGDIVRVASWKNMFLSVYA